MRKNLKIQFIRIGYNIYGNNIYDNIYHNIYGDDIYESFLSDSLFAVDVVSRNYPFRKVL